MPLSWRAAENVSIHLNLGIDREKVFVNLDRYGNTSSASSMARLPAPTFPDTAAI